MHNASTQSEWLKMVTNPQSNAQPKSKSKSKPRQSSSRNKSGKSKPSQGRIQGSTEELEYLTESEDGEWQEDFVLKCMRKANVTAQISHGRRNLYGIPAGPLTECPTKETEQIGDDNSDQSDESEDTDSESPVPPNPHIQNMMQTMHWDGVSPLGPNQNGVSSINQILPKELPARVGVGNTRDQANRQPISNLKSVNNPIRFFMDSDRAAKLWQLRYLDAAEHVSGFGSLESPVLPEDIAAVTTISQLGRRMDHIRGTFNPFWEDWAAEQPSQINVSMEEVEDDGLSEILGERQAPSEEGVGERRPGEISLEIEDFSQEDIQMQQMMLEQFENMKLDNRQSQRNRELAAGWGCDPVEFDSMELDGSSWGEGEDSAMTDGVDGDSW